MEPDRARDGLCWALWGTAQMPLQYEELGAPALGVLPAESLQPSAACRECLRRRVMPGPRSCHTSKDTSTDQYGGTEAHHTGPKWGTTLCSLWGGLRSMLRLHESSTSFSAPSSLALNKPPAITSTSQPASQGAQPATENEGWTGSRTGEEAGQLTCTAEDGIIILEHEKLRQGSSKQLQDLLKRSLWLPWGKWTARVRLTAARQKGSYCRRPDEVMAAGRVAVLREKRAWV